MCFLLVCGSKRATARRDTLTTYMEVIIRYVRFWEEYILVYVLLFGRIKSLEANLCSTHKQLWFSVLSFCVFSLFYPVVHFVPPFQELLLENLSSSPRSPELLHDGFGFPELLLINEVLDTLQIRVKGLFQRRHGDPGQHLMSKIKNQHVEVMKELQLFHIFNINPSWFTGGSLVTIQAHFFFLLLEPELIINPERLEQFQAPQT